MQTKEASADLDDIQRRLHPRLVRKAALDDLNDLFRSARAPEPPPDGFLAGSLIATTIARPVDSFVGWLKDLYMPWLGKSFDATQQQGSNVLKSSARSQMKLLSRNHEPRPTPEGTLEAFPFKTRVAPGALDPNVDVLKIDYDFEANPSFIIRHILDELVQIDAGLYLGKVIYRRRNAASAMGFFSLSSGMGP